MNSWQRRESVLYFVTVSPSRTPCKIGWLPGRIPFLLVPQVASVADNPDPEKDNAGQKGEKRPQAETGLEDRDLGVLGIVVHRNLFAGWVLVYNLFRFAPFSA